MLGAVLRGWGGGRAGLGAGLGVWDGGGGRAGLGAGLQRSSGVGLVGGARAVSMPVSATHLRGLTHGRASGQDPGSGTLQVGSKTRGAVGKALPAGWPAAPRGSVPAHLAGLSQ